MTQHTAKKSKAPNVSQTESSGEHQSGRLDKAKSEAMAVGEKTAKAVDDAKAGARQTVEKVKTEAASMAEDVQAAAADVAGQAKQEGQAFLDRQKNRASEEVSHFEAAIRRASETLREEDDDNLADYAERAAAKLSRVKDYLNRQELGDLLHDVEQAARRRPELVFGGLLVAGLATARFLKASSRTRSARRHPRQHDALNSGDGRVEYASAHQPASSVDPAYEMRRRAITNQLGSHES